MNRPQQSKDFQQDGLIQIALAKAGNAEANAAYANSRLDTVEESVLAGPPGYAELTTGVSYITNTSPANPLGVNIGGTGADLSLTGGVHQVVMQESTGSPFTVRQLAYGDISGLGTIATLSTITGPNITTHSVSPSRLTGTQNNVILGVINGIGVYDIIEITCTNFARTFLDDTTASAVRTTLGLGALATQSKVTPSQISPQGSGSTLDADTLDGHDTSYFATAGHSHDLGSLTDIEFTLPSAGQVLTYNGGNWTNASPVTYTSFTNELAQDAIGSALTNTSTVKWTYNDASNTISADVSPANISHAALSNLTTGDPHTQYQLVSGKNANSGYAGLNSSGIISPTHLGPTPATGKVLYGNSTWASPTVYQTLDTQLTAIAATSPTADTITYFTSNSAAAVTSLSAAARTVIDDATVAAMVNTLGGATSTGTGGLARASSPSFTAPTLGNALCTTINKHTLTPPTTAHTYTATADNTTFYAPVTVLKTSNETINASPNLHNDSALLFTTLANTKYHIKLNLWYNATSSPDFKIQQAHSGTTTGSIHSIRGSAAAGTTYVLSNSNTLTNAAAFTGTGSGIGYIEMDTYLDVGASGGTYNIKWSQNTSAPTNTIVYAGSHLTYRRLA